ncbi:hypothetical protein [Candidatus Protochlamydia sp. R18]|uniref:hypothetical protein n=1 Tax=Candidatus Protochlamydia sp. R18 TaxID=1353977 RepID=UPI0005A6C768|nr:hypothetical protein [Candidatus Protochlamydia sp. R18]
MGDLWKPSKLNTAVLSLTICVFTLSTVAPLSAAPQQVNLNLNDLGFALRIEKLVEKVNHYRKKGDSKKLMETMFDMKAEVEGYTGQKINLDKTIDQIEQRVKNQGGKVDKKVIKELKKDFKKQEKRTNHKALYMANCMEFDLPYHAEDEQLLFDNHINLAKHSHGDKGDEICVPLRVTIGITVTLCGLFLLFVPIPICKQYAPYVIETGLAFLVDEGITQWEDKDKDKK